MSNIAQTALKEIKEIREKQKDKDKDTAEKVIKAVIKK